jgi:hypothetical protein
MLGGGGCHNSSSSSSSTWGSAVGLHCRLHSFVKQVLIQQLVPSGALVSNKITIPHDPSLLVMRIIFFSLVFRILTNLGITSNLCMDLYNSEVSIVETIVIRCQGNCRSSNSIGRALRSDFRPRAMIFFFPFFFFFHARIEADRSITANLNVT